MMPEVAPLILYYCGHAWHAAPLSASPEAAVWIPPSGDGWLPELEGEASVERLILPIEPMLVRHFELPLQSPRLLDADILGQEIDEMTGEEPDDWWLSWEAEACGTGDDDPRVAGMVFGMPTEWKDALDAWPPARQLRSVEIDACLRLGGHLESLPPEAVADQAPCAVLDADSEGLFFGVWQPLARGGYWRGMRRLNLKSGAHRLADIGDMAEQCMRSLRAMGWEHGLAMGMLDAGWLEQLKGLGLDNWQGETSTASLASRIGRTLAAASGRASLNLRHGRWSAPGRLPEIGLWRRSIVLALMLFVLWLGTSLYHMHALEAQAEDLRQRIEAAFHQGLPHEPVMIDALAQLRRAAGGPATASHDWVVQLAAINRVYGQSPWTVQELEWRDGRMTMAGKAESLEALNAIRDALQQEAGRPVKIDDTDLSGEQVNFRMSW